MLDDEVLILLAEICDFTELLPVISFIWFKKTKEYKFIFWQLIIAACLNILSIVLSRNGIHNLYLYHILGLSEIILIPLFYYSILKFNRKYFFVFFINILLYLIISNYEGFTTINALSRSFSSFVILIHGILFLRHIYINESSNDISKSSYFIINAAFLIFFSSSFFTFLMSKEILSLELTNWFGASWLIYIFANLIKNLLLVYAAKLKAYG